MRALWLAHLLARAATESARQRESRAITNSADHIIWRNHAPLLRSTVCQDSRVSCSMRGLWLAHLLARAATESTSARVPSNHNLS